MDATSQALKHGPGAWAGATSNKRKTARQGYPKPGGLKLNKID